MKIQARFMLSLINSAISMFFDLKKEFLKEKRRSHSTERGNRMVRKWFIKRREMYPLR